MRYGDLVLFTGPMFAGKTNAMVREILFRTYFTGPTGVAIYKIAFDNRFDETCLVSHDGLRVQATRVSHARQIVPAGLQFAFFDEIQFFSDPNFEGEVVECIRTLRGSGVDVFCAGLDMDYLGRAFEVTALLMAEATRIERLTARCSCCAAPATHTARIDRDSDRFVLGSGETYSAMCAQHWFSDLRSNRTEDELS